MALNITRGFVWKAQKVVIYGPEGIGKSTFASQFPEPLFIDTEGSTNLIDVARLPRPTSWTMLLAMVQEVKVTPGCCKTLIIDTMDWAEQLCVAHVCAIHSKKGIEDFGYGKGHVFVKEEIGKFLNLLQDVIDAGINVVLTAHTQIRKFELPDECGSYDRYELKLGNKTGGQTSALVKEWADMVLFANYKQYVVEINEKKKAQGGARVMHTVHHPCWDAKNRHDLKPELPFEFTQIAYCIPNHETGEATKPAAQPAAAPAAKTPAPAEPAKEASAAAPAAQASPKEKAKEEKPAPLQQEKSPPTQEKTTPPAGDNKTAAVSPRAPDNLQELPKPLADLMAANSVTVAEIQQVVAMKGYYPQDTPVRNYDPDFIDGVLVGAWDQVLALVVDVRQIPFQ
ncbi:MAG: ATP-binding protein [Sporomusaceae bacterium]|nr:ATP-binding protein [Sporomusaceae bacterium]